MRGQRHLLKNIQRRKSSQSWQIGGSSGSSEEASKITLVGEIELLRKERSSMMQELVELQHQQQGTVQHMELVNEKLQKAEKRQKQMISFLGKMFQNPALLAGLQQTREQKGITSHRTMRKFVKHQTDEAGLPDSSPKGQIVKYRHEHGSSAVPSVNLNSDPVIVGTLPGHPLQEIGENPGFGIEDVPFQVEDIAQDESDAMLREFLRSPEQAEAAPALGSTGPHLKGKAIVSPPPEYFISFPEDLVKEKKAPEFSISRAESMAIEDGIWSMGFEAGAGMPSSTTELWSDVSNYDVPEIGGLSDFWDIGPLQSAGSSSIEKWPDEVENKEGQHIAGSSEKMDP